MTTCPRVGEFELFPCMLNEDVSLPHMTSETGRSSPYDKPYDAAVVASLYVILSKQHDITPA